MNTLKMAWSELHFVMGKLISDSGHFYGSIFSEERPGQFNISCITDPPTLYSEQWGRINLKSHFELKYQVNDQG